MPAMSPTMTEGGIANWKKAEGDTFVAGDVLLEIETDKATIDVEAQDDGIMGKILVQAGENKVPVGQVIAILAEEGDDISSIEVPTDLAPEGSSSASASTRSTDASASENSSSSSKPAESKPEQSSTSSAKADAQASKGESQTAEGGNHHHQKITHSKPLFSSVIRLQVFLSCLPHRSLACSLTSTFYPYV
jgi:pyruvate/2-oxoglutarate dehydrogenase complex dihydrolipoamide acyltransferase (E2) component